MEKLPDDFIRETHELIKKRIMRAPTFIKRNLSLERNNYRIIVEQCEHTILVCLLNPREIKNLKWRQKNGLPNFPALITDHPNTSFFRLENTTKAMVGKLTLSGNYAFSVGPNSSIIIEKLKIELLNTEIGDLRYVIDLGFIIRPPITGSLYSPIELLDDLIVYYIKNAREDASHEHVI